MQAMQGQCPPSLLAPTTAARAQHWFARRIRLDSMRLVVGALTMQATLGWFLLSLLAPITAARARQSCVQLITMEAQFPVAAPATHAMRDR